MDKHREHPPEPGNEQVGDPNEEPQRAESGMDVEPERHWAYERTQDADERPDDGPTIHPPA